MVLGQMIHGSQVQNLVGEISKEIWICWQSSPNYGENQYEKCTGMGNLRFRSHKSLFGISSANVKCPTNNDLDGSHIKFTTTCTLALPPDLPAKAREAHIIPGISHHSLLSMVHLCSVRYEVIFTKIGCYVRYRGK